MPLVSACFDRRDGHVKEHDVPRILFHRHNLWEMVLCTGGTGAPVQSVMSLAGTQHFHTCHCLVSGLMSVQSLMFAVSLDIQVSCGLPD